MRHADFLLDVHRIARGLLAVPERRIEYLDFRIHRFVHWGLKKEAAPLVRAGPATCQEFVSSLGTCNGPAPRKREKKQAAKKKVLFHSGFP